MNLLWPVCVCREKAKEMWEWLHSLEEIKYDHCEKLKRQRYEVGGQRGRGAPYCLCMQQSTNSKSPNAPFIKPSAESKTTCTCTKNTEKVEAKK